MDADMINIFEVFLPQLLRYPNPNDPLNGEAAALLMRHPKEYESKVKGMRIYAELASCHIAGNRNRVCSEICYKGGCGCVDGRERRGRSR